MKSLEELKAIRDKMKGQIGMRSEHADNTRVVVGMATCGIASGARPVLNLLVKEVEDRKLEHVTVTQTGCIGLCQYEPIVEVYEPGKEKVTYVKVNEEKAKEILEQNASKTEEKETTETDRELPSNLVRMFTCADLDAIILAAEALHGFYQGKNTLYKNPQEHTYHLIVHQSQHTISEFNRVINLICSYLKPQKYTAGLQAFYEEHFQKIIRGNALQQLGKIT